MKIKSIILAALLCLVSVTASYAQFAQEQRPFDFNDKYYQSNGVIAEMLIGRKNGADGESVFDVSSDRRYSNVRITATFPGYDSNGTGVYWNYHAGVSKAGFTLDDVGPKTVSLAFEYPMYVFPATTVKHGDRQAALIRTGEKYFSGNPLGIAAVYFVDYTELIYTKEGKAAMELLGKRNGFSLDGTPIIRTASEIDELKKAAYVTLTQPSLDEPYHTPFAIAKIIQYPKLGGITPDAFLKYVTKDGKPLDAEAYFVAQFECLKGGGICF